LKDLVPHVVTETSRGQTIGSPVRRSTVRLVLLYRRRQPREKPWDTEEWPQARVGERDDVRAFGSGLARCGDDQLGESQPKALRR
jgi:hypothetical protein